MGVITGFKLFTYKNNNCQHDIFIAIYIFNIYDHINNLKINTSNSLLFEFNKIITDINMIPDEKNRNIIWPFFINNYIDILETIPNNRNIISDNGFGKCGMICQLSSIFKNNVFFCLVEQKNEICEFCGNAKSYPQNYHDLFININENNINLNSIEFVLLQNLILYGFCYCNICNLGEKFNICRIYYKIASFSKFLFILFDFNSYDMLLEHFSEIKKLSVLTLKFIDKYAYKLSGVVITPYTGYFTFYINSLNMPNVSDNVKITLIIIMIILIIIHYSLIY